MSFEREDMRKGKWLMNNKMVLVLICLVSVGVFAGLGHYGWTHRYGSPETFEVSEPRALVVPFQPKPLKLEAGDVVDDVWQETPSVEVQLLHQITERPWPKGLTAVVQVQAFHDGKDIYFRLAWKDDVANRTLSVDGFADGCAVAVPLDVDAPVRSIMMGFSSPVNIWHWQAHRDAQIWQGAQPLQTAHADFTYPFEDEEVLSVSKPQFGSAVTDLAAQRAGSLTPKDRQIVQGRGQWQEGTWTVVLKRSLKTTDTEQDCQFPWGSCPVSFAVWDGDQGDRGARKSLSEWVILDIRAASSGSPAGQGRSDGRAGGNVEATGLGDGASVAVKSHRQAVFVAATLPSFSLLRSAKGQSQTPLSPQAELEPELITVVAKRFSYNPNRISVKKGQRITLRLESLDVTHGLYLDGYGIDIKARPGMVGKATFTADKPGRFTFRCSETCGEFHPYMVGFMEVTPNTRFGLFATVTGVAFVVMLSMVLLRGKQERGIQPNDRTE